MFESKVIAMYLEGGFYNIKASYVNKFNWEKKNKYFSSRGLELDVLRKNLSAVVGFTSYYKVVKKGPRGSKMIDNIVSKD